MKGLIIKDLFLMKKQLKFIILFFLVSLALALSGKIEFGFVYIMIIVASITQSTINYDEFDNGFPFLMSLPISRNKYVQSKFLLALLLGLLTIGITLGLYVLVSIFIRNQIILREVGFAVGLQIFLLSVLNSVYIPLILKYGAEKSKMAILLIFALLAFIGFLIGFLRGLYAPSSGTEIAEGLFSQPLFPIGIALMFSLPTLILSYEISIKIFSTKEF